MTAVPHHALDDDLRNWLEERFDRIATEMRDTRHAQKASLDQITTQVVTLVQESRYAGERLAAIEEWRKDGGALDTRFQRHDERIRGNDAWRNRMAGAIALLVVLFPVTVGVIVAVLGR